MKDKDVVIGWTGLRYTNNPCVFALYMGVARMPYYNNLSLQGMLW